VLSVDKGDGVPGPQLVPPVVVGINDVGHVMLQVAELACVAQGLPPSGNGEVSTWGR